MKTSHALVILLLCLSAGSHSQTTTPASTTRTHVEMLASEKLEGRQAGSLGERQAAAYLANQLAMIGAKPLPGRQDFFLPFEFTAGTRDGGTTLGHKTTGAPIVSGAVYQDTSQVQALSFSDNGEVSGAVVFAGYGLVVPESQGFSYDSYATLDVKDKVVLVLRYFPEDADRATRAILARYADLRYKAMAARQRGAKALLVVTGPRSPNAGETIPMSFDTALAGSGIVAASVSATVAQTLLGSVNGKTLESIQKELDSGNPHVAGFAVPDSIVTVNTSVVREKQQGRNVVAYLPATSPTDGVEKPWIALGAHYDHLGRGSHGNSLAEKTEAGQIHYGADDNASGSAAVLAIAELLSTQPRHRNILLAFWSAEEIGLVGSTAFVSAPPIAVEDLAGYFNFDMVGRMHDNKLTLQAVGTSAAWRRLIEQANVAAGFDLVLQDDPYQPTDVASFNQAAVASLAFFTGTHADYHRPSDTADKINYDDLERVVQFAAMLVRRVGDAPEALQFTKVDQPSPGGGRAGVRVFTGTIPDYATEVKGLLLGGVIGGGPAEQAGLQKGDVIIELADQTIANIYDYTYALELLKINEAVKVVYMRGGERRETMLTPAARK
ncbi:MAG: M20/M25/M40 family metallo-hydrolase [Acidobacteria bacterium]|nr:M20/M25/M40 family metallo-hydrolase [Acidobacteriota bacterium]